MDDINGISFEDWAAACGNMTQGMPEEQILEVLGVELPIWQDTMEKFTATLTDQDVITRYSAIFAAPKVGKFADVDSPAVDIDELLKIAPDYNEYQKIFWHQSIASQHGVDPVSILESYGLDLGKWGTLNTHYIGVQNQLMAEDPQAMTQLMHAWREHFTEQYADQAVDLADDIEF